MSVVMSVNSSVTPMSCQIKVENNYLAFAFSFIITICSWKSSMDITWWS
jgi:hypothetical protein